MGRRFTVPGSWRPRPGARLPEAPESRGLVVRDAHWAGELRSAVRIGILFFSVLLGVDALAGSLTWPRACLWAALGLALFSVLLPPLVRAAPGRLTVRGLVVVRTVRTDALVSVRWTAGVAERVLLEDDGGSRVEIAPGVLVRSPALWLHVDADAQRSVRRGTLSESGATALRELAARVDAEAARSVFKFSGLD